MAHLGSLTIFFCWIVLVSGVWLLIFFRTSVNGAFASVQYLTEQQWYLGGVMRSVHRYASDAAIVTIALHIITEFSRDTYRLKRWFSWVTGLPVVWLVFLLGISGYWLVWDELAQYVAITSSELLDRIPIFTDKMAANFLRESALSDRFFTLMAFLHLIGLPIFLVFGIWLHVFRLSKPDINPPRRLMAGTLTALLILAVVLPVQSHERADLALVPNNLQLDWLYLHIYPLVQFWSPGWVWMFLIGISALLLFAPWLPPAKAPNSAAVSLDNCNGCERCFDDCPYDAITMQPRTDGKRYQLEAVVDSDLCARCGICVGACPTATPFRRTADLVPGIDLPDLSAQHLKKAIDSATSNKPKVLSFACVGSDELSTLRAAEKAVVEVACIGQIPPSYIDYILSRDLCDRILIANCSGGCRFRFGTDWAEQRIERQRDPYLRQRVDAARIVMAWRDPWRSRGGTKKLLARLEQDAGEGYA